MYHDVSCLNFVVLVVWGACELRVAIKAVFMSSAVLCGSDLNSFRNEDLEMFLIFLVVFVIRGHKGFGEYSSKKMTL